MRRHQHPTNNAVLRAPEGMPHDQCESLPVTRVQFADGQQALLSFWTPSAEELALLNAGKAVRLTTLGLFFPPTAIGVDGDGEVLG